MGFSGFRKHFWKIGSCRRRSPASLPHDSRWYFHWARPGLHIHRLWTQPLVSKSRIRRPKWVTDSQHHMFPLHRVGVSRSTSETAVIHLGLKIAPCSHRFSDAIRERGTAAASEVLRSFAKPALSLHSHLLRRCSSSHLTSDAINWPCVFVARTFLWPGSIVIENHFSIGFCPLA